MNIRTSAFRGLAILSLTALGMAACEDKDEIILPDDPPPAVEVTVVPTQATIPVGGTAAASAVVKNATNTAVTWACLPAGVVTISATGVITGVAPGSAVCTATSAADANAKGAVSVTVTAPVVTLTVLPTTATINSVAPGNTIQLATTVSGSTNQAVTCVSSATGVATVASGLVTAVAPGTAVITCTAAADANVKSSSVITVVPPVVTPVVITIAPTTANTTIGGTVQLVPIVTGTTNTAVTYASSDITVATVSAAGVVTGVKGGTAVITVTSSADPTKKATSVITVAGAAPVASISIASVVDHDTGTPVVPDDISGQIDVTVNVSAVPENGVMAVVVYVDNVQVCRQNFTNPLGTTQGVATINCPVNTAEYNATTFDPKFLDGNHIISAKALKGDESVITTATFCPVGGSCFVIFDNDNFIGDISLAFENTVGDWHGGDVTVTVEFVNFSTDEVEDFTGVLLADCDDDESDVDTFDLTFANGAWTGTTTASGTFPNACVMVGDVEFAVEDDESYDDTSDEFQLDNEAPYIATTPNVGSGLYYNDAKTITATVDDYGVDSEDPNTIIEIRSGSTVVKTGTAGSSVTTAGLAETATNTGYQVWVYGKDALGNEAWFGPYGNFGIDFTEPTVDLEITGDITDSGEAVNDLPNPILFDFDYIDAAAPPAGPSGFNPNPVTYSIVRYDAANPSGVTVESGSVNDQFDLGPTSTDGYYVVNATVTDAAGNFYTMPTFTLLVDDTPPYIGTLTVPSVLTGGTAYSMSAQVTDNVDLGEGWATIGYNNAVDGMDYWLIQQKSDLGAYGLPLATNVTLGTITIPTVVRSIRVTDPATNLAGTVVYTAKTAEYAILDVAGEVIPTACPAVPAADDATTLNCRVRTADIGPAYNVGNPTGTTWSGAVSGLIGLGTPGATGFAMDAATTAIDATATGQAQTFNNPFAAVYFYGVDATGRAHFLGTGSVSVTDDTILQIRTWRYTLASSWSATYAAYTGGVFALVYGTNGDVLVTQTEPHP